MKTEGIKFDEVKMSEEMREAIIKRVDYVYGTIEGDDEVRAWYTDYICKLRVSIFRVQKASRLAKSMGNPLWVAFSGGKDSQVLYDIVKRMRIPYEVYYNVTNIDIPENVRFIRDNYKEVKWLQPERKIWEMIEKNGMPSFQRRFCCRVLKEETGAGRVVLAGDRALESRKRSTYGEMHIKSSRKEHKGVSRDLDEVIANEHKCIKGKDKVLVYPILEFSEIDVWVYILLYDIPINPCYKYFTRVGCMFCYFNTKENMRIQEERYPKFRELYVRAIDRHIKKYAPDSKLKTGEEMFEWGKSKIGLEAYLKKKSEGKI